MNALVAGLVAEIPSPPRNIWHLGPFPIRAYALAILAGIVVAVLVTRKRWVARGGDADDVLDIAFWMVPFGIVGGRLYHVITTPEPYWGKGGDPIRALYVWDGGLGIWGAIALGAVGAYIGCRRLKVSFPAFADALAPGLLFAQGIGRLGNWFNQELFGGPTTLPWGLHVSDSVAAAAGYPPGTLFHPTFLYELIWDILMGFLVIYLDRKFRLGHGRVFWLYVMAYTSGRIWIEMLRIDQAERILGLRLNVWTCMIVGLGGLVAFLVVSYRHPGREETVSVAKSPPDADDADGDPADDPADADPFNASEPRVETEASSLETETDPPKRKVEINAPSPGAETKEH